MSWRDVAAKAVLLTASGTVGPHLTRYYMYRHLRVLLGGVGHREETVLTIGDSGSLCTALGIHPASLIEANYPGETMLGLDHPDDAFDMVMSDQVLEHVEGDPAAAVAESIRVAKPGGLVLHTTCFINPIHWGPKDLWRFTPDGLTQLIGSRAEVVDAGGWGNHAAATAVWLDLRMVPVPDATWHPVHKMATRNDPARPIVTWIVARKPTRKPSDDGRTAPA